MLLFWWQGFQNAAETPTLEATQAPMLEATQAPKLEGRMKTILIVDDKPSLTRMLQDFLSAEGFRTVIADNGRNAIYTARHSKPDLILLDLMMPEMDGFQFLTELQKTEEGRAIPLTWTNCWLASAPFCGAASCLLPQKPCCALPTSSLTLNCEFYAKVARYKNSPHLNLQFSSG
jgi:Response regulator receiver domain